MLVNLEISHATFHTSGDVQSAIKAICAVHPDIAHYHELGTSEEGRLLYAVTLGKGPLKASLIAGSHADEPVGPETLRLLIVKSLENRKMLQELFSQVQFIIIPHINPDGEAKNWRWIEN